MQSNHHHRETAVSFHKSGGHSHDGTNSTRIDFSSYSDADLAPLIAKITKKIKSGGNDNDSERLSIETQPTDDLIPTGAPLVVTLTSGYNDASSGWGDNTGWIKATWTVYDAPGDITGDDDADDLLAIGYMEGDGTTAVDDTDQTDILVEEVQSAEAINEYQVSYWNIAFEDGDHVATSEHKKFIRTDEQEILIAPVPLGKTFHVRVRGISGNGKHSDPASNDTSSHILTGGGGFSETPSAPTGLDAISMGPDSIMLTWTESTHPLVVNGGNYRVQCDTVNTFNSSGGNPLYARTVGGESTTFTGLQQGTNYYFRVKAKTSTGVLSAWSSTLGPETTTTLGPGDISDGSPPSSSPAANVLGGPKYLWVKWNAVTNNDPVTYDVHLSTSSGFTVNSGTKVGEVSGTSFVIRYLPGTTTELSYGTTYYVKIVARDQDGSASAGTQGSASCVKIAGGTGGDILADSITANDINSLTLTGTKYVQAGGASATDPYVRMEVESSAGHIDIYPGKSYSGTEFILPATLEGASDSSTKEVWTYLSSPYFSGDSPTSRPVYMKLLTDNDDSTRSEFFIHAQKFYTDAREEGILYAFTQSINRNATSLTQLTFGNTEIVGNDDWSMSGTNLIKMPRIGKYMVTFQVEYAAGVTNGAVSGDRGARTFVVTKGTTSAPSDSTSDYYLDRIVMPPFPDTSTYTFQRGAASGSVILDCTSAPTNLRFWMNNYTLDASSADCNIIIGVYRVSA